MVLHFWIKCNYYVATCIACNVRQRKTFHCHLKVLTKYRIHVLIYVCPAALDVILGLRQKVLLLVCLFPASHNSIEGKSLLSMVSKLILFPWYNTLPLLCRKMSTCFFTGAANQSCFSNFSGEERFRYAWHWLRVCCGISDFFFQSGMMHKNVFGKKTFKRRKPLFCC